MNMWPQTWGELRNTAQGLDTEVLSSTGLLTPAAASCSLDNRHMLDSLVRTSHRPNGFYKEVILFAKPQT